MEEVAKGNITLAAELFDRYHIPVYNYFLKVNRDRSLADDLTQTVFEKLIKYRTSYGNKKSFKSWLFTIVRNVNIDHHRRKRVFVDPSESHNTADRNDDVQVTMEKSERSSQLMKAITRLSTEEREIITLTKFEKFKYAEVAQMLKLTETGVKTKVHRTIKKLRHILVNDIKYEY